MLDSGNFSDNSTVVGDRKTKFLLQGMQMLGYDAANVGERDLQAGFDHLEQLVGETGIPLISSNIVRRDTKQPVFAPHVVVDATSPSGKGHVPVGVIGVARFNPIFRKAGPDGSELEIVYPTDAVRSSVEELKAGGVRYIVLLAAMHVDDVRRLLAEVPGIDFVVGSYGGNVATRRDEASGAWLLYAGNQGKRLGETRIFPSTGDHARDPVHHMHYLNEVYPGDPAMMEFLNNLPPDPAVSGSTPPADKLYVGSARCRECHASAYAQWASTPHASAYATLDRAGKTGEAACVTCHATGAGQPGGFESFRATPGMAHVGCEACHGPGRTHVARTDAPYGAIEVSTCTGCHDLDNSPEFDYYAYRDRVRHTRPARP